MTEKGSDSQFKDTDKDVSLIDAPVWVEEASHESEEQRLVNISLKDYVDTEPKQRQFKVEVPDPKTDPIDADPLPPPEGEIK